MRAMQLIVRTAVVMAGACVSLEPEPVPAPEVSLETQALQGESCPTNSCGNGNSPVIDGVHFWRLHIGSVPGLANPEEVRVTSIVRPIGGPMRLELVGGDRLRGVDPAGNIFEHTELQGTEIHLKVMVNGVSTPYVLFIERVAPSVTAGGGAPEEWFWVGNQRPIEAYSFYYRPLSAVNRKPVCAEGDRDPNRISALVFGGDRYDPQTKSITDVSAADGWINIACRDSAIYKMHKIGHTRMGQLKAGIPPVSIERRRAMLNAWTANVCGTGTAYTKPGEPIKLRESLDVLPAVSDYLDPLDDTQTESIEAIWNEKGAVCLNVHRLDTPGAQHPIPCRAALPSCDELLGTWDSASYVVTGNPFPAP